MQKFDARRREPLVDPTIVVNRHQSVLVVWPFCSLFFYKYKLPQTDFVCKDGQLRLLFTCKHRAEVAPKFFRPRDSTIIVSYQNMRSKTLFATSIVLICGDGRRL